MPESHWVLREVEVDDAHHGDGVDRLLTKYRYTGGV
jgi:hypothetical protein